MHLGHWNLRTALLLTINMQIPEIKVLNIWILIKKGCTQGLTNKTGMAGNRNTKSIYCFVLPV